MLKNIAGQSISALLLDTLGAAVTTGTTTVYVTGDGGTQASGGTATHEGNGVWSFLPSQANTNYDEISFLFTNAGAVSANLTVYPDPVYPVITNASYGLDQLVRATTPANTFDVSAAGGAGIDWANVESQDTAVNLTATTIAGVDGLSSGSAAISAVASTAVITTGTETNTYTATTQLDGTLHTVEDAAGTTDFYYQFSVGGDGVPVEFVWDGSANTIGDTWAVSAYNWGSTSWDQIGTLPGSVGATVAQHLFQATNAHVGTGANLGMVRLRFNSTDGTQIVTDRVLCSYAVVARSVGYAMGSIWVDTNLTNTNTESYVDGVADNPVSTWAAALTIAGNLGINRFHVAPGSSITLSANSDSHHITAYGATVALGGQSISGAQIEGALITGNDSGTNTTKPSFTRCEFGNSVLGRHVLDQCRFTGNITLAEAGDYLWDYCSSFVAGNGTPDVTFPVGNANLNVRHYSGGMEINAMASGDTMSFEAMGQFKIAADCTGGVVSIRGAIGPITDLAAGAVTLTENARIADDTIRGAVGLAAANLDTQLTTITADTNELQTMKAASILEGTASGTPTTTTMVSNIGVTVDGQFNGRVIIFDSDTATAALQGQATDITACTAVSNTLTFTALTTAPASGDTFKIV